MDAEPTNHRPTPNDPRLSRLPARLVVFDSIHHVLAAERAFRERRVWCDLVPIPRDLSSDCGMALQYRPADHDRVVDLLNDPATRVRGVYESGEEGQPVRRE